MLDAEKIMAAIVDRIRVEHPGTVPPGMLVRYTVEVIVEAINAELEKLQRKPEPGSRFVVEYEDE